MNKKKRSVPPDRLNNINPKTKSKSLANTFWLANPLIPDFTKIRKIIN